MFPMPYQIRKYLKILKSKINKNIGGQGHIHTTINTLKHRIDEIENENSITTL